MKDFDIGIPREFKQNFPDRGNCKLKFYYDNKLIGEFTFKFLDDLELIRCDGLIETYGNLKIMIEVSK